MEIRDTVIIGSGCAGLTAAIYAGRANMKPLVFQGHEPGGQLSITTLVENFPGWPEGIQGPELIENLRQQAQRFGAEYDPGLITTVDLSTRPFTLHTDGADFRTRTLIIASGASARWLGLPSEQALIGRGVSSCATCDGFFFRGQQIAVVGGGDSALEEALFLTRFATKVTVVHRRDQLRASRIMQDRALANERIEFRWNAEVIDVLGEDKVAGIRLRDTASGEESEMDVTGLFVAIGHQPNSGFLTGQLELANDRYIRTFDGSKTSVDGVFACGDVQDHVYRQAVTAAGSGCMAAIDAERWLETRGS